MAAGGVHGQLAFFFSLSRSFAACTRESSRFAFVGSHFSGLKHFETQTEHIRSIRLDVAGADLL